MIALSTKARIFSRVSPSFPSFPFQPDMPDPQSNSAAPNRKRVTLSDVARHVGVGPMTVSRALRTPELVSSRLRSRILKPVDELGYFGNRAASGLAFGTA